jgi:hypothetical protein
MTPLRSQLKQGLKRKDGAPQGWSEDLETPKGSEQ